jgi:hypothetical protein
MTFSILEVVSLLIVSNLRSYVLGKYYSKTKLVRCSHVYETLEDIPGECKVLMCRHCGDIIEVNIEK